MKFDPPVGTLTSVGRRLTGVGRRLSDPLRWLENPSQWVLWQQLLIAILVGLALGSAAVLISSRSTLWIAGLVAAVGGAVAVLLTGQLKRWLLAIIVLDIPLQLDNMYFYQDGLAARGANGGLALSLTTMALVGLYALWIAHRLVRRPYWTRPWFRLSLPLTVYVGFVLFSFFLAENRLLASFEIFLVVQLYLLWIFVVATTRTREDVRFLVGLLFVSLALEGIAMIAVGAVGRSIDLQVTYVEWDRGRVGGTLNSPIIAAGFLYLLLAPALSAWLTNMPRVYKTLALIAFALGSLALLLTYSRAGWFAYFLSCGIVLFLAWRRGWLAPTAPLILIAVVAALGLVFQDTILARVFGDDGGSASARLPLIRLAQRMIADNPFGVGINNFAVRLQDYAIVDSAGTWLYTVHNKFFLVLAETGPGGLVGFLWFLGESLRRGWVAWQQRDRFIAPLALAFSAAILGNMTHMLVDIFQSRGVVAQLWLVTAIITVLYVLSREQEVVA